MDPEHDVSPDRLISLLKSLTRKLAQEQSMKHKTAIHHLMFPPPPIAVALAHPPIAEDGDNDEEVSDEAPVNGNGRRFWGYPYYYGYYYPYY